MTSAGREVCELVHTHRHTIEKKNMLKYIDKYIILTSVYILACAIMCETHFLS